MYNENDATVYLDKFLDEAIDVYNTNDIERKSKQLNIPAIILIFTHKYFLSV